MVSSFEGNFVFGGVGLMDRMFARMPREQSFKAALLGVFLGRFTGNLETRNRG